MAPPPSAATPTATPRPIRAARASIIARDANAPLRLSSARWTTTRPFNTTATHTISIAARRLGIANALARRPALAKRARAIARPTAALTQVKLSRWARETVGARRTDVPIPASRTTSATPKATSANEATPNSPGSRIRASRNSPRTFAESRTACATNSPLAPRARRPLSNQTPAAAIELRQKTLGQDRQADQSCVTSKPARKADIRASAQTAGVRSPQ